MQQSILSAKCKPLKPVHKLHTSKLLHWLKTSMVSFNGELQECMTKSLYVEI